jgi:hypothetical protein
MYSMQIEPALDEEDIVSVVSSQTIEEELN